MADSLAQVIASGKTEALASFIENGGDLSGLNAPQRAEMAAIIRGKTGARNREICRQIAYLIGTGMRAYSDSGPVVSPSPVVEHDSVDACTVVAETLGLEPEYVRRIWARRTDDTALQACEAHGKKIAALYRAGAFDPPPENEAE